MAKNNKYASINFNHIYEKTISTNTTNSHNKNHHLQYPSPSSSSSASYSAVSAPNKPHGRILVLTRPTPKPVTPPTPQQPSPSPSPIQNNQTRSEPGSDAISLRPLGRTGTGSPLSPVPVVAVSSHDKDLPSPQPLKTNKFVPPHLRPGFVPREVAPGPELGRPNGRPKSGGGHDRMRRPPGSDAGILGRGSRPSSSGWYFNVAFFYSFIIFCVVYYFIHPFVLLYGLSFRRGRICLAPTSMAILFNSSVIGFVTLVIDCGSEMRIMLIQLNYRRRLIFWP